MTEKYEEIRYWAAQANACMMHPDWVDSWLSESIRPMLKKIVAICDSSKQSKIKEEEKET